MARAAALVLVAVLLAAGCGASSSSVSPLSVVEAPTPPLRVAGYETSGTFPQVKGGSMDLQAVNAALREAVLADQRAYTPYARSDRKRVEGNRPVGDWRGVYRTEVDRKLVSANTVVVSALLQTSRQAFRGQRGGDGWVSITVLAPSGKPVTISELFAARSRGLRVFGRAWRGELRRQTRCPYDVYESSFRTSPSNYRRFALTADGLAVGVETYQCGPREATVPYRVLRPFLSKLGATLVAGVRRPR